MPHSARLLSARTILLAGLGSFALWLFLDARQLYQSAVASPIGARRSVAMTILRPIARVEDALGADRIVNAGNRAVGKTGSPGGSALGLASAPTSTAPTGHDGTPTTIPTTSAVPTVGNPRTKPGGAAPSGPAGLAQPTAAHPLTVLDIGDSIGEDLGIGLADELGGLSTVHLIQASVGDTGLANLGYYNWLAELPVLLAKDHPQVVVVMLGGNDAQPFQAGTSVVQFGTAAWHRIYAQRVAQLMSEASAAGARVLWVGLPIMGPTSGLSNTDIAAENAVFAARASANRAVSYLSTWRLFENANGQYSTYLPIKGALVEVRDPDEIHIDPPGGTDLLGAAVVHRMEALWHVAL